MLVANDTFTIRNGSTKKVSREVARQLKKFVEQSMYDRETIRETVGVDRSTMSRHLNGKIPLTYNKIEQYSRALDINIHQLIGVSPMRVIGQCWENEDVDRVDLFDIDDEQQLIYPTIGYDRDVVCVIKHDDCQRPWLKKSVVCFSEKNMKEKKAPEDCQENYCFIKYRSGKTSKYKLAIPYQLPPTPGAKRMYSLVSPSTPGTIKKDDQAVEIIYACPILDWVLRAKSQDWKLSTEGKGESI